MKNWTGEEIPSQATVLGYLCGACRQYTTAIAGDKCVGCSKADAALAQITALREALRLSKAANESALGAFEHAWAIDWNDLSRAIETADRALAAAPATKQEPEK